MSRRPDAYDESLMILLGFKTFEELLEWMSQPGDPTLWERMGRSDESEALDLQGKHWPDEPDEREEEIADAWLRPPGHA